MTPALCPWRCAHRDGSKCAKDGRLLCGGRCSVEESALRVGLLYPAAGDVEVARLDLDADELAAELGAGDARRAAAHEGVTHGAMRQHRTKRHHQRYRLRSGVVPPVVPAC